MLEKLIGQIALFALAFAAIVGLFLMWTMPDLIPEIDTWIGTNITPEITPYRVIVVGFALVGIKFLTRAFAPKRSI